MAYTPMAVRVFALVAKSAHCPMCGASAKSILHGPLPKPVGDGDWQGWMRSGDTGTSSETIWSVMTGLPVKYHDTPHDPSDFGRCYRLLKVMPSWRARLQEVADAHPRWAQLVVAWDELTALYEEELPSGMAPKCYERIQALRNGTESTR